MTKIITTAGNLLAKTSPTAWTYAGVIGLGITTGLSIYATKKATDKLKEHPNLTKMETIKKCGKYYIPTAIVLGATAGSIIFANKLSIQKIAAITASLTVAEQSTKKYREKVWAMLKDKESKDAFIKQEVSEIDTSKSNIMFVNSSAQYLFYDSFSGRLFMSDKETIREAVNNINEYILADDLATLNEFYRAIGAPELTDIKKGDEIGWRVHDNPLVVRFDGHMTADGRPCIAIDYDTIIFGDY